VTILYFFAGEKEKALTLDTILVATLQVAGGMRGERFRTAVQFPIWRCTAPIFLCTAPISCDLHRHMVRD
jgi:hypothetical protein